MPDRKVAVSPALALHEARSRVREAIDRNRLIEGLVHKQEMRERDRVESLVHKQNDAFLFKLLQPLSDDDIGRLLAEFDEADQLTLWRQVPAERADGVLLAVPDDLRERLVALMPRQPVARRVTAFSRLGNQLLAWGIDGPEALKRHQPLWIDLIDARPQERLWVESHLGFRLPDPEAASDLESSARFYVGEEGAIHLYSDFLLAAEDRSRSVRVVFLLHRDCLISLRKEELPVFRLERVRAQSLPKHLESGLDLLLDLYGADVEYSASCIESVDTILAQVGHRVLDAPISDQDAVGVLALIGGQETLNGQIRRNLMDTRRALSFLGRARLLDDRQAEEAAQIVRDIDSLDGHTAYMFDKINFLMDATVGFININQNRIIRLFSVASVAMLPPTLIASVYGMNFREFPELEWAYGYPMALVMMGLSVLLPFMYFRRRGWLR